MSADATNSKAERFAARQAERAGELAQRLESLLDPVGTERLLDVGTGTGALAFALAPRVRQVTALDLDSGLVEQARATAPPNVDVLLGDGERLPFVDGSFELAATLRTLHHTPHPELLLSELRRVVRADGRLLVADQLAPDDPDEAVALNRFESAREPSTTLILTEADLRRLFAEQRLVVEREEIVHEPRDLERYLDLAGCEGVARDHARSLAPAGYEGVLGWFVLRPAAR